MYATQTTITVVAFVTIRFDAPAVDHSQVLYAQLWQDESKPSIVLQRRYDLTTRWLYTLILSHGTDLRHHHCPACFRSHITQPYAAWEGGGATYITPRTSQKLDIPLSVTRPSVAVFQYTFPCQCHQGTRQWYSMAPQMGHLPQMEQQRKICENYGVLRWALR
jgi:hypothetical protein